MKVLAYFRCTTGQEFAPLFAAKNQVDLISFRAHPEYEEVDKDGKPVKADAPAAPVEPAKVEAAQAPVKAREKGK